MGPKKNHRAMGMVAILVFLTSAGQAWAGTPNRRVAVTFDDVPGMNSGIMTGPQVLAMNTKLVDDLKAEKIPVIGFVNEYRLYHFGEVDERIHALSLWPDAGFDLGNHTFSHTSLNHSSLADWEEDVLQGETVTRMLMDQHHKTLQYFRYPYLDMGADLNTRREGEEFLADHGYRIAPVTLDAWDWYFASVYADARNHNDTALEEKVAKSWLEHSDQVFAYYEKKSRALFGYEPSQVLLLHDTWLEADHVTNLLALMRKRGYRFISLGEALNDQAYASPDTYISDLGLSSIDHWAIAQGKPELKGRPAIDQWVQDKYNALAVK